MRDSVIFDMDGVLIDSQPLHFDADLSVLRSAGAAPVFADVERRAGIADMERWPAYKREFGLALSAEELTGMHSKLLMKLIRESDLGPIDGIPELLILLNKNRIKTAVASSSSLALINLVLGKLQISKYFETLVTGGDVTYGKPAPDIFLAAAKMLGSAPERCIVIEDSANGVLSAKRAGMRCVAYKNPSSGNQDLSPADVIINSFDQINHDLSWLY